MSSPLDTDLTVEIDVCQYASMRKQELDLLRADYFLGKENVNKSLFQTLPRHMRRRTMGYLRKRLPRRIRAAATIKPPSKIAKRPSRKYRRRAANLCAEYARRKRATDAKMWLETHIWHAKRFHLSPSKFGYRLPLKDNCKCKRAVFKCLRKYCCMHDESYYVCMELEGAEASLISGLNQLCSQQTGLTFAAKMTLSGQYEGRTVLYEARQYPRGCIGPVRFLWKAKTAEGDSTRALWITSHPSIHEQVQRQIVDVFNLRKVDSPQLKVTLGLDDDEDAPMTKKMRVDTSPPQQSRESEPKEEATRKLPSDDIYVASSGGTDIRLKSKKDRLIRFKLVGPMSTAILANALQTVPADSFEHSFYDKQASIWNKIKQSLNEPNDFPASYVLGLLVKDPRLMLPRKKAFNKVLQSKSAGRPLETDMKNEFRTSVLSRSTIWDDTFVNKLNATKMSTHAVNQLRAKCLIPGSELQNVEPLSKVPVLLVQSSINSGVKTLAGGSLFAGWDLIVPETWAMAFWLTLVHLGARAVAQEELNYLLFESGNFHFPYGGFADSAAGQAESASRHAELYAKHSARPASKRANFFKLHFFTPFSAPWQGLVRLHDTNATPFFILRNRTLLNKMRERLFNRNKQSKLIDTLRFKDDERAMFRDSYVAVRVQAVGKGTISEFSLLYMNCAETTRSGNVVESNRTKSEIINKILNKHKYETALRLRDEKTVCDDKKPKVTLNTLLRAKFNKTPLLQSHENVLFAEFEAQMAQQTSQPYTLPIGFVVQGGYTLLDGKCSANAYILSAKLVEIIDRHETQKQETFIDPTLLLYKIPTVDRYMTAKICDFLI